MKCYFDGSPYRQAACRARPALHLSWLGLCVLHQAHLPLTLFGLGAKNHSPVASKWRDCQLWLPSMDPSSAQPPPCFTLTVSRFGLAWALKPLWYEGAGIPLKAGPFPPWRESHRIGYSSHYCEKTPKQNSAHSERFVCAYGVRYSPPWQESRGNRSSGGSSHCVLSQEAERRELSSISPPSIPCSGPQPVEWCYPL